MTRHTIHVPNQYNDGTPHPHSEEIEQHIIDLAGGYTLNHGAGGWCGEEQCYREPVALYHIDSENDIGADVLALAERIARWLDQEAVYVTRQEIETFFVSPAREEIAQ